MKTLIVCESYHHGNTLKVAQTLAGELQAEVKRSAEVATEELAAYDLIGFGSGIYDGKHHLALLALADKLPDGAGKKTFVFSTSGVPVAILGDKFLQNYKARAHKTLLGKLEAKGYKVIGDLILPGFNTNVFLKYFGGLNKGRPDQDDLEKAKAFASNLKNNISVSPN
jgi:flavodoxin